MPRAALLRLRSRMVKAGGLVLKTMELRRSSKPDLS
jgi:hypothetical protein